MTVAEKRQLAGLAVFSHDGTKIGKIKDVISDGETSSEYLVIGRFLSHDLVVPADLVERSGNRLEVPFSASFLEMAPTPRTKGVLSSEDRDRVEHFYRARGI